MSLRTFRLSNEEDCHWMFESYVCELLAAVKKRLFRRLSLFRGTLGASSGSWGALLGALVGLLGAA